MNWLNGNERKFPKAQKSFLLFLLHISCLESLSFLLFHSFYSCECDDDVRNDFDGGGVSSGCPILYGKTVRQYRTTKQILFISPNNHQQPY